MSVKVAVRVRPFNNLEIQQNQPLCIDFGNDYSSFEIPLKQKNLILIIPFGLMMNLKLTRKVIVGLFQTQDMCSLRYNTSTFLRVELLRFIFWIQASIYSYQFNKSGRSYTLSGTPENQGLIQNFVKEIFQQIAEKQNITTKYEVYTSMLFIFNEKIYDQLSPTDTSELKIRENELQGVFVENLTKELVDSPKSFDVLMNKGIHKAEKYLFKMSYVLSYANIIFKIEIKETKTLGDQKVENFYLINFVDLVCSDRMEKQKDSNKNIGTQLSTLGEVICKVLLLSQPQDQKIFVPYRCSKLTRFLQNTLNQKSNIFLFLSISPAIDKIQQTLSSLKFANKIMKIKKNIINNIKVSENQQILEVNEAQIQTQTKIIQSSIKQQIENTEEQESNQNTQYFQQFDNSEAIQSDTNIKYQAIISTKDGIIELQPLSQESCEQIFINNHQVKELTKLSHGDRISFGNATSLLIQYSGTEIAQTESKLTLTQKDTIDVSEDNQIIQEDNKSVKFDQN